MLRQLYEIGSWPVIWLRQWTRLNMPAICWQQPSLLCFNLQASSLSILSNCNNICIYLLCSMMILCWCTYSVNNTQPSPNEVDMQNLFVQEASRKMLISPFWGLEFWEFNGRGSTAYCCRCSSIRHLVIRAVDSDDNCVHVERHTLEIMWELATTEKNTYSVGITHITFSLPLWA